MGRVPIEVTPPKYIRIINALQQRIEDGTYPAGATLPSETKLIDEFDVSRPTVVRALEIMRQQGWIEAQHGKGRTVRGKPTSGDRALPAHTAALLSASEVGTVTVLQAGPIVAPPRATAALGLRDGTAVIARRRLMRVDDVGPVELSTVYVPVDLGSGTGVGELHPLKEGLLPHLTARKSIEFDHVVERVSARIATADEVRLLELPKRDAVLTVLLTICDASGAALVAIDMVLPASRHELEDVFPLR